MRAPFHQIPLWSVVVDDIYISGNIVTLECDTGRNMIRPLTVQTPQLGSPKRLVWKSDETRTRDAGDIADDPGESLNRYTILCYL